MSLKSLIGYEEISGVDICRDCDGTGKRPFKNRYISGVHVAIIAIFAVIFAMILYSVAVLVESMK